MCGDGTPPAAIPLFLAGEIPSDRALFTWYHPPPAAVRRRAGIVICPPLGYEYMSSYRALRILAERLAALGFDTLRVDYDGTGNSEGCADDPSSAHRSRIGEIHFQDASTLSRRMNNVASPAMTSSKRRS